MSKINILECTLRDGSYRIGYQFSAEDTAVLAAALENAGFRFIEIGHGLGLGASAAGEGMAAACDEAYLKAAKSVLKKAKFGAFFIPGIGTEADLKLAAEYGMDFVRIGTNATEVSKAETYVKLAKRLGMEISLNLMKSYSLSPLELSKQVKLAMAWGIDIVYVVDSAGGMLPRQVSEYVQQLRANADIPIGFHGHNNFDLAVANTLAAIESGATYVDCTLQGMGRSAGNAPTEVLIMILDKLGYDTGIEPLKVMNLGESFIKPMAKKGISSIDVIEGYALFHSKFLELVHSVADRFGIDPRELIMRTSGKGNTVDVSEEFLASMAAELLEKKKTLRNPTTSNSIIFEVADPSKSSRIDEILPEVYKELATLSRKREKTSVFTISSTDNEKSNVSPFIRESGLFVMGNSVIADKKSLELILSLVDGKIDILLVDNEVKNQELGDMYLFAKSVVKQSRLFPYSDELLLARICEITIVQLAKDVRDKKLVIFGSNTLGRRLSLYLAERGAKISLFDSDFNEVQKIVDGLNMVMSPFSHMILACSDSVAASIDGDVLIGASRNKPVIRIEAVKAMLRDGFVFDAGVGSVYQDALQYAMKVGIKTYRSDMKAGLSGEVLSILETDYQLSSVLGRSSISNIPVVAGGILGRKGDVIIDSISNPTTVLGIADGHGGFVKDLSPYLGKIKKIKSAIINRKLLLSLESVPTKDGAHS